MISTAIATPRTGSQTRPVPTATPMAAVIQMPAAVVRPMICP